MAGNSSSGKGNPAHTRMSNDRLKARRERSWKRGEAGKLARRQAQQQRENANRALRGSGTLTAWQMAEAARAKRRAPLRQQWLNRNKEHLLSAS